jgi:CMP/dCMP kinase
MAVCLRMAQQRSDAPVITIDGPTASGKGTVARQVAGRLGFHYLDSGALYRSLALASLERRIAPSEIEVLVMLARELPLALGGDPNQTKGAGAVSDEIRTEAVSKRASMIAAHAPVRAALIERQRAFRAPPGLVADGRDMGTVVFPDADLKVFLTASVAVRVHRRYRQLVKKGFPANIDTLWQELVERDARDSKRAVAPLKPAQGAKILDTSNLCIEQTVMTVIKWFAALSSENI